MAAVRVALYNFNPETFIGLEQFEALPVEGQNVYMPNGDMLRVMLVEWKKLAREPNERSAPFVPHVYLYDPAAR